MNSPMDSRHDSKFCAMAVLLLLAASILFGCRPHAGSAAFSCQPEMCMLREAHGMDSVINVSYPFGTAEGCGASTTFLLSNCSSSSPSLLRWCGFLAALDLQNHYNTSASMLYLSSTEMPYVTGISKSANASSEVAAQSSGSGSTYVNLTWIPPSSSSQSLITDICQPPSFPIDLPSFLPSPIRLNDLGFSDTITISDFTHFLLLNCVDIKNLTFINTTLDFFGVSAFCEAYVRQCNRSTGIRFDDNRTECLDLTPLLNGELNLAGLKSIINCSHFQMLVQTESAVNGTAGMLQLTWLDEQLLQTPGFEVCQKCESTGGACGYDTNLTSLCFCPDGNSSTVSGCNNTSASALAPPPPPVASVQPPGALGYRCGMRCKIGIGVGVPIAALAICVAMVPFVRSRYEVRRRRREQRGEQLPGSAVSFVTAAARASANDVDESISIGRRRPHKASKQRSRSIPVDVKEFRYEELLKATNSFAEKNVIGRGRFGSVYGGILHDGRKAAIKRLYHDNFRRTDQFYNELNILLSLRHPNLVKFYGYCNENDKELLLVFEYASKGSVWDQLHGSEGDEGRDKQLPWRIRLRIALETAEALSYLHNSVNPPIYHRDVKSSNILLDEELHAKVADFGISRLVPVDVAHVSTAPQGTPGYVDPDYNKSYQLTDKSDVYSFGVVMVELVSGQMAVDMGREKWERNLSSWARSRMAASGGRWEELLDPWLRKQFADEEGGGGELARAVVEFAVKCVEEEKEERPDMKQVADALADIMQDLVILSYNKNNKGLF